MQKKMDGEVFIYRQNRHFPFIDNKIKILLPFSTLNWRVNIYVSRQGKGINRRNESTITMFNFVAFGAVLIFLKTLTVLLRLKLFPHKKRRSSPLL